MKTRWLRFSLRTLLLIITAICVWIGIQVNAARRQREAVATITKAGGTVVYDYQNLQLVSPAGITWDDSRLPPGPAWLRHQIGDDYFQTVVAVSFWNLKQRIEKGELAKLPHVTTVLVGGFDAHDGDLVALAEFDRLEVLIFLTNSINGSILKSLPNPNRLRFLYLHGPDVDDAALEPIGNMAMLTDLQIGGVKISDAGVSHLRNLANLEHLALSGDKITDAGLAHLQNLSNLTSLELAWGEITDAGLQQLTTLRKLTNLSLYMTKVSQAGIRSLRAALPTCYIDGPPESQRQ